MEVWALEGFGAAYLLQEFLTVKSDELYSRNTFLLNLMKRTRDQEVLRGDRGIPRTRPPESFRVLVNELQSLCLSVYYNPDFRLSYPSLLGNELRWGGLRVPGPGPSAGPGTGIPSFGLRKTVS
jgi:hypothetical protein